MTELDEQETNAMIDASRVAKFRATHLSRLNFQEGWKARGQWHPELGEDERGTEAEIARLKERIREMDASQKAEVAQLRERVRIAEFDAAIPLRERAEEIARLRERIEELHRSAITSDAGWCRCIFCAHEALRVEEISHATDCVMEVAKDYPDRHGDPSVSGHAGDYKPLEPPAVTDEQKTEFRARMATRSFAAPTVCLRDEPSVSGGDQRKCRAPHCWSEYGTPCGECPEPSVSKERRWWCGKDWVEEEQQAAKGYLDRQGEPSDSIDDAEAAWERRTDEDGRLVDQPSVSKEQPDELERIEARALIAAGFGIYVDGFGKLVECERDGPDQFVVVPKDSRVSQEQERDRCEMCGRVEDFGWHVEKHLWDAVVGGDGIVCPPCFWRKAQGAGVNIVIAALTPDRYRQLLGHDDEGHPLPS